MRYLTGIVALTVSLSCAAPQARQPVEHKAGASTPSPTATPVSYESASSSVFRDAKNEIPNDAKQIIDRAENLEIILLNAAGGRHHPNIKYKLNSKDRYYGYEVLGKAVLSSDKAKELRDSLYSSVAAISVGQSAMCFAPRHGLRATYKGRTAELLICFQCMNFYTYTADGQRHPPMNAISRGAQPVFNRMLSEAGVSVP